MPVNPTICTLTEGQMQQFALPNAAGAVTWRIAPNTGTIAANGLYTAPPAIPARTQVVVTAAVSGVPDEVATVDLVPAEVVLVPAGTVILTSGQVQQFTACVPGDPENSLTWNLSPTLGEIAANGLYTPPNPIPRDGDVIVTATWRGNPRKSATTTVRLVCEPPKMVWLACLLAYLAMIFGVVILLAALWPPDSQDNLDNLRAARIAADTLVQTAQRDEQTAKTAYAQAQAQADAAKTDAGLQKKAADAKATADKTTAAREKAESEAAVALDKEKHEADRVRSAQTAPVKTWFGDITREVDLIWLVLLTGALGSFVHGAKSFVGFVGNRTIRLSWTAWYLMYPLIGAALAMIFYMVVRGGLLTPANKAADVNLYGLLAICGMVGMFSKQATNKLDELFTTMFKTETDESHLQNKIH